MRSQPLLMSDLDVYVLSAAYGLIPASQLIPRYDLTMAPERADALRPEALKQFALLMRDEYGALCLGLSQRYMRAITGWEQLVPSSVSVTITDGPMGVKLGQLRAWLLGEEWEPSSNRPHRIVAPAQPRGSAQLRGQTIILSAEEVLAHARHAVAKNIPGVNAFREWYVMLDGKPVSAKWLVSIISGLPTSAFDASAARRVLLALGVDVERLSR